MLKTPSGGREEDSARGARKAREIIQVSTFYFEIFSGGRREWGAQIFILAGPDAHKKSNHQVVQPIN